MKSRILPKKLARFSILAAVLATAVSGCSGGATTAGVGTGGTGSIGLVIAGKVADGYLRNALVFLDKNGNYQADAGEPVTVTDTDGSYTLTIDSADGGKYPIVALATKGMTTDHDTNTPVPNSYLLSLPAAAVTTVMPGTGSGLNRNFISPLTTLLREVMETGSYQSLPQAMADMRTRMGLSTETDLLADYLLSNNSSLHASAQSMTTLMGNQMNQIFVSNGTVDVNRYRAMMGMIYTNLSSFNGAMSSSDLAAMNNNLSTVMAGLPAMGNGQPFRNMSSYFRNPQGGMSVSIVQMGGR